MSNSLYEPILKEGGSSKRPIDFYIEEFELYKTHCKRSVRYMLYYFVGHIGCSAVLYLVLWIFFVVSFSIVDIVLNLCAYLMWCELWYHFRSLFRVLDPHMVNTKQIYFLFIIKLSIFKYYLIFYSIIFVLLAGIHSIFPYQLLMLVSDFVCLGLTVRVILQVKFKEQNLANQINLIKASKVFAIQKFIISNEKEPLQIVQVSDDESERASVQPIKVQGFLQYYKPKKTSKLLDVDQRIDETQVYSH